MQPLPEKQQSPIQGLPIFPQSMPQSKPTGGAVVTLSLPYSFSSDKGGGPKSPKNFIPPTNAPQLPPATVPPGETIRIGPKTQDYPDGYWRQYDSDGHPVDPSTGKYPDNVPSSEVNSKTHVPLPPGTNLPPGPYTP